MEIVFTKVLSLLHLIAALALMFIALLTIGWSMYEIIVSFSSEESMEMIPLVLESVGAIIIAAAVIDVARYMVEEEVFQEKELRNPAEARKTITKIMVIIAIAVSIEGLVYIFKAGTQDIQLLIYPACLVLVSSLSIVALGIYQKLSVGVESETNSDLVL